MSVESEKVWKKLREGLDVAYRREFMSPKNYMMLYTGVYDYCTSITASTVQRVEKKSDGTPECSTATDFVGHEMYRHLEEYVGTYVVGVCDRASDLTGEDLLKYFTTEWENFRISAKVMDGIFSYLNRHWIKKELDEGRENIYMVYTLALVIWKQQMFDKLELKVIGAVLDMIYYERCGNSIVTRYVSGVIECLVEMGIDDSDKDSKSESEAKKLAVYKGSFEGKFIDASRDFYKHESTQFLQNGGNVTDYMIKVETRLQQEDDRVQLYLNSSTKTPLSKCCEEVLISQQLEFLQSHFGRLLVEQQDDDLARMYYLCSRVANGLDHLRASLERHITKVGHEALERVSKEALTDPKLYVKTLLEVHERYQYLVDRSFKNEPGFMRSLDKAATSFVNINAVTEKAPPNQKATKSAELLARYSDQLLKKSSKLPDEAEIEVLQTKIMVIFKYIEDKDVFSKYYTKMFSKRLISDLSASDEAEASFIAKLTAMCGYEYTARLSKMVNDTQVSKDLTSEFKEKNSQALGGAKAIEFNMLVLSSGSWPTFPSCNLTLPKQLSMTVEAFGQFYNEKFNGRRLTWAYSQSRGEVTSSAFPRKYIFSVTTAQMCALLLFNEALSYKVQQITEATGMDVKTTTVIVGSLVKNLVLKSDMDLEGDEVSMLATVSLNKTYQNKKVRVDLSKMTMKQESARDTENVQKTIEEDRKNVISACIVRIMKTRKRFQHQQLMTEVITQLSGRFKPKVEMIKRCMGSLIEKDYMKRVEDQRDLYEYIA